MLYKIISIYIFNFILPKGSKHKISMYIKIYVFIIIITIESGEFLNANSLILHARRCTVDRMVSETHVYIVHDKIRSNIQMLQGKAS